MTQKLLIATGSKHKLAELSAMLDLPNTELVSLADLSITDEADETGRPSSRTRASRRSTTGGSQGWPRLPTTRASRWTRWAADQASTPDATQDPTRRTRRTTRSSWASWTGMPADDARGALPLRPRARRGRRGARDDGGHVRGPSRRSRRAAEGGFGYDPIFEPETEPAGGRTVGQLTQEEKNSVSHRAAAAHAMRERLIERGY